MGSRDWFRVRTLGDIVDSGGAIAVYCAAPPAGCGRTLEVDVYDLTWHFGRRTSHIGWPFPLRCAGCGGRRLEFRVTSETRPRDLAMREEPTNFRRSRTREERDALITLYPRRKR